MLAGKRRLLDLATDIAAISIAIVALLLLYRRVAASPPGIEGRVLSTAELSELHANGSIIGRASAPVTITIFSDFQCPWCGRVAPMIHTALNAHPDQLRLVFHHFPLDFHEHAASAAIAAECAHAQGKFGVYHDALFARQDDLGIMPWDSIARRVGVGNLRAFAECISKETPKDRIERDKALAMKFKVSGTPTIYVNGMRFGGGDERAFEKMVNEAISGRSRSRWAFWRRG